MWSSAVINMLVKNTGLTLYMTLVSTVFAYILGLPMGTLLHAYVMGQIKIDLMCFDVRVAPLSYLISAALTLVFGLLVNLALRRKIRAIDMSQALKSIE